jgi:hypothetical protein
MYIDCKFCGHTCSVNIRLLTICCAMLSVCLYASSFSKKTEEIETRARGNVFISVKENMAYTKSVAVLRNLAMSGSYKAGGRLHVAQLLLTCIKFACNQVIERKDGLGFRCRIRLSYGSVLP